MNSPALRAVTFAPDIAKPKTTLKLDLRRVLTAGIVAILSVSAGFYGYDWLTTGRFTESTNDAYVGGEVTIVAPKVAGFVARVAVTDNQAVHTGDLLVKLDDRDYRAALAKAEAAVNAAQAAIANYDATSSLQESLIKQAQADVIASNAEVERSREDQDRYHKLAAIGGVSIQGVQKADADYKEAVASESKAEATVTAAQRQLAVIASEKRAAEAALGQAIADRDIARLNLSYTELRAPIDGTVANRSARAGAYATIGSELLAIVPARGLWVDANFKESQIADLHPGQPVSVKADALPGEAVRGRVVSLAPATGAQFSVLPPENATGNFTKIVQRVPIRILLEGDASQLGRLRPGLSVTVDVNTRP
jgi:membrane fusion protein, multidrug efflux system